ncbi:hypothetical protein GCM10020331_033980 [Ectobacillus funiculus]
MKLFLKKQQLAQSANDMYLEYFPLNKPVGHPLSFYRWLPIEGHNDALKIGNGFKKRSGIRVFFILNVFLSGQTTPDKYLRISLSSTSSLDELKNGIRNPKNSISVNSG